VRTSHSTGQAWFAASLLPFKLYTAVAGLWMLIWHSRLPSAEAVDFDGASAAWWASSDFAMAARYVVSGYFLSGWVLILGGLVQVSQRRLRSAFVSMAFGRAALIIGLLLGPYLWEAEWRRS
jgi:hypothetical protein